MSVFDTFTKRRKRLVQSGQPVILRTDAIPVELRNQIIHIWRDAIGMSDLTWNSTRRPPVSVIAWKEIHDTICRELGILEIESDGRYYQSGCETFLLNSDVDNTLDIIDLSFHVLDSIIRANSGLDDTYSFISMSPDDAIKELNHRFLEHNIGYQFAGSMLIEISSQYTYSEMIEPTVMLLHNHAFSGPNEEFMNAHKAFRSGEYKISIVEANKSFESTMKAICDSNGWSYPANATSATLIRAILDNGLIPSYLESELLALRSVLESGLPSVRNRSGGHGQGAQQVEVPSHLAAFAIHQAAANILLIVKAHEHME